MTRLPDLVHDTRLNTSFKNNITIHHYDESDDENNARSTLRSEHWEQTNHLGRGSYGDVWLQQCVSGKRGYERRAVKIISRLRLKDKKNSYMAELEAISKFSQKCYSKCFVKLLGWYDTDSSLYIAMEYVPLGDLEKYMSDNGPMPEKDAQQVSFQVLQGLSYMHREGFAHRDIKPGLSKNVLIKSQPPRGKWWVKISDFGISKRIEESKAQSTVKGTIQYMAPELIWHEAGNDINYMAADMWALGTMVYRMLTLMPVFPTPGAYNYYLVNVDSFPLEHLKKQAASSNAVLFIRSLMGPRPGERLSADTAMEHAWVASFKRHPTRVATSRSASKQPVPASNLNPWATISTTSSAEPSIEARQPTTTPTRPTSPILTLQSLAMMDSRLDQIKELQRQVQLRNAGRKGNMSPSDKRELHALIEEVESLSLLLETVFPAHASHAPSPIHSIKFIDSQPPAVHDALIHNVQDDPVTQRRAQTQSTDADGPDVGESQNNSQASLSDCDLSCTVVILNIAAVTTDVEVRDFFGFWFVSFLPHFKPFE
ncbi:hypothetical protein MKX08_007882 [Trichoderma sp. CBMAI-0020]|nr:hypothetical protein MKX08_007882 [Trichoderma sp. CBMAI-0020]